MKIGLFSYFYFPTINGVVISMDNLRRGLEELGHKVYLFAPKSKRYPYPSQIKIINFPSINIRTKGFFLPIPLTLSLKIFKEIKKLKLDLIHTQHPFYVGESAFFYAKRFKIPLVFTFHTVYDLLATSYLPFLPQKVTAQKINQSVRNFASRCDGVIVPNKVIKNKYLQGIKTRTAIIPSGLDWAQYQKKKHPKKDEITLLTVTRLSKEKNVSFLIKVFSLIAKRHQNCQFLIVGDGPERKNLEKLAKAKKLSKITFIGQVEPQKTIQYYQKADLFLYSSLADTQALAIFEAMAAGLAVVALDSPEMRAAIRQGKNGLLVPLKIRKFANQVERLIENSRLRRRIGFNASKTAKRYSYQNMARQVANFYQKIIKFYR